MGTGGKGAGRRGPFGSVVRGRGSGVFRQLPAAHVEVAAVALGQFGLAEAELFVHGDGLFQRCGGFLPFAAGGQRHAQIAEGKGRVLVIAQQAGTQGDGLPVQGDAFGEMPAFLLDAAEIVQACAQFRRNGVFRLPYFPGAAQQALGLVIVALRVIGGCPACFLILKGVVISSHETNRFS